MELSVQNGGSYCALNPQKTACVEEIPFSTSPLSLESKCAAGKTEVTANAFPSLYLYSSSDLKKKKIISSIGDTYTWFQELLQEQEKLQLILNIVL